MSIPVRHSGRIAFAALIVITLIAALIGVRLFAVAAAPPPRFEIGTATEPTFTIGPIEGLTTTWHWAPRATSIPLGTIAEFFQPAPPNATVNWTGASEVARDDQGSTALCPLVLPGINMVKVEVIPADGGEAFSSQSSLNVVDIDIDQITVSAIDVRVDPVVIDADLPQDEINEQTMGYFFGLSIAALRDLGDDQYRTSVNRMVQMSVEVDPPGFAPLIEWRFDGEPVPPPPAAGPGGSFGIEPADGMGTSEQWRFLDIGNHIVDVGPLSSRQPIEIETYSVTITSHTSGEDTIPEGEPIVFIAETDPPGYEDEITWLSSTKYGTAEPILGEGPIFIAEFNNTWGIDENGAPFQWLGVKPDNAVFNQDLGTGACCLFEENLCIDGVKEADCTVQGGVFQGEGTTCADDDVNCVLGACCLLPTVDECGREVVQVPSCIEATTRELCAALGGVFLPRTPCEQQILVPIHTATEFSHRIETINNCPETEDNPDDPCNEAGQGPCTECTVFIDSWKTVMTEAEPDDNTFDFAENQIPAGFFFPGSEPFAGLVPVKPMPDIRLDQDDVNDVVPGACPGEFSFGDADTLVLRTEDPFSRCDIPPDFPSDPVTVDIEVISLNLVGCGPITVEGPGPNEWIVIVSVNTDHDLNGGSLTATKEHCNGGTFTSVLFVCPVFTFVDIENPDNVRVLDVCEQVGMAFELTLDPQGWVHDPGANVCLQNPVCTDFHPGVDQTPPDFDCTDCQPNGIRDDCDIDPTDPDGDGNVSPDCNNNGVPDECEVPQSDGCPIGTCTENCSEDCNENCIPDECEQDTDNDGFIDDCDCDPLDPNVNPGADEVCDDGIDNDCDTFIDCEDPDCDCGP